ncbi:hypothetical protein [Poseidonibacter ostreae]|jgi:hypothetical protein|uniref:Uncharacterized protein n=1 Tax=Poseidonibacter ostreae TaxID=2654171 RepID=A0A6L4WQE5_9BACT|nr:hypothetical protein [Poseidonibacter ostreae]KAB7882989.1 hypothetical protein GA417_13465 [Poseidonibacter ostreae]KAB7886639.1 hypothetical protein GBG19_11920 [Poseidonibacter ostreae]KAB7889249.1 hypothetical protein GBG18_11460 [Poseidonibacter ostreae]
MSFLEKVKEFLALAQETNFDIAQIFAQNPNGVYATVLVLLVILLIIVFFIRRAAKISSAVKLVSNIQNSNDFDDYDSKLTKLATELPKRGQRLANSINAQKNDILEKELNLLKDFNIKDKISRYKQISAQYALISTNSKKFKIDDLTSYYDEKSKTLLSENLVNEITEYSLNTNFDENDVEFVNSIVSYANSTEEPEALLNPLIDQINRFSYSHNLDLFKFTRALDKDKSVQVYKNCNEKLAQALSSEDEKVSNVILSYMLENDEKEEVYSYITNLKSSIYLQDLYYNFFAKTEDIDVDLAFVANETKISSDYSNHIDCKITDNWRDLTFINHIIKSPRVLETIGHISYRNVLERIERLEKDEETNKAISEVLQVARRAEAIANEAKEIARQK